MRQAARPALGAVPAGAEAVIFEDAAELLACLAGEWCEGSASTHWWWRSLFKSTEITTALYWTVPWLGPLKPLLSQMKPFLAQRTPRRQNPSPPSPWRLFLP